MPLRAALPRIPVPLRSCDAPGALDLQSLLERAYRNGRYSRTLPYHAPPAPPLEPEDAAWADELLRGAGKR
jgi:hypothetical protein